MNKNNKFGYFDDDSREYVITAPQTPSPWLNYLGYKDYLGIISNTAGGYSFYRDARLRRLSRYHYNAIPKDNPGRYIYICDGNTCWNPHYKPVSTELDSYQCRHGLGYTVIEGALNDLAAQVTYFVPVETDAEIWLLKLENRSSQPKSIDLFSYLEFCLWNALDDCTNFQRNYSTGEVEVEASTIYHKTEYRERRSHFSMFHCSEPIVGFDTDRDSFIGNMGDYGKPIVVNARQSNNSIAHGWSPIGSHHLKLQIEPGESKEVVFVLGYVENPQDQKFASPGVINKTKAKEIIADLACPSRAKQYFLELKEFWQDLLGAFQTEISNEHAQRMANTWNPYQCMVTFNVSRSASGYESGIGRGLGYRDSNQDLLGSVHMVPKRSRQRILDLAATQNQDGSCYHQYQPLTKKGNEDVGTGFSDDPLWLILSCCAYIKETGDWSILTEHVGFQDRDSADSQTNLLDHLELSVTHVLERLGPHGLPLIGHADWNDCLNLNCFSNTPGESFQLAGDAASGKAESVMVAQLLVRACRDFAELLRQSSQSQRAVDYDHQADKMQTAIMTHAWDGQWFRRAYDHFGRPVGSSECEQGKIFIETQGWAVMAGLGLEDGKAQAALDSAWKYLAQESGMALQYPTYSTYKDYLGEISSYPPGYKENGGIFCHNNTWMVIAECILGRADRAWDLFTRYCPSTKQEHLDTYNAEPYCFSQMIAGDEADTPGQAKNSWLTGTASWSYVALTQYILGIRAQYDGLRIDPCIPSQWPRFTVNRCFRGVDYEIKVENPNRVTSGVRTMMVNGRVVEGNLVSIFEPGEKVSVTVELGKRPSSIKAIQESRPASPDSGF